MFCNVVTPRKFKENGVEKGDAKYDITIVVDKETLKPIVAKAAEVARAKWPNRELKELRWPWITAEKAIDNAGRKAAKENKNVDEAKARVAKWALPGTYVLKAASKFPVQLAVLQGRNIIELSSDILVGQHKGKFYNGCYVVPQINLVPYTGKKVDDPDGVTAYLDAVLRVKDGERLGGGVNAAEAFKGYAGAYTSENPVERELVDEEIPF